MSIAGGAWTFSEVNTNNLDSLIKLKYAYELTHTEAL